VPRNGHGRPKNNGKEPEEDNNQPHRMRDDFHQPASSTEKNCCGAETNEQTKFAANESVKISVAFSITVSGHERDHIHGVGVMQSADGRGKAICVAKARSQFLGRRVRHRTWTRQRLEIQQFKGLLI
jgi:hypothetical protein